MVLGMKGLEAEVEVEMGSSGVAVGLRGGFYGYADMKAKVESLLEGTEKSCPETLHAHGVGTAGQGLLENKWVRFNKERDSSLENR